MSEAVKRYDIGECNFIGGFSKMLEDEAGEWVYAADHDRIASALTDAGRKMQAECDQWQREAIRLASAVCALGKMEFDQLTDDSKLIEVMSVIREAIQERDTLRAEVERLRQHKTDYMEAAEETRRALSAEVERLRIALSHAGAWIEAAPHGENCFVSSHYDGDPGSRCNCGKDSAQEAIESAMEASR
ncbi:hypothetical protein V2S84_01195 [Azotobacter chroococcum]|nr:hypothetical protein [Azotobacter chroococcum]